MRYLVASLVVGAALAGCAGHERARGETHPSTTPVPGATSSMHPAQGRPAIARAPWRTMKSIPRSARARGLAYNGRYAVYWDDADPDTLRKQAVRVFTRSGRLLLEVAGSAPSSFVQSVWLSGDFLVVEEINETARRVHVTAYELPSGRVVRLPGPARPTQPEMDASRGRIAFVSGAARTRMCVQVVDLDSSASETVACRSRGEVLGDLALTGRGVIFSAVANPNSPQRCKRLFIAVDGTVDEVPLVTACRGWSGAVTDDAIAWDEMDPAGGLLDEAIGYVRTEDAASQKLEPMTTDTILACGDRFYWQAEDGRGVRIDRRNADGSIQTIWKPEENLVPVGLVCTDSRWLSMRTDDIDGVDEHLTLYVLDTAG